MSDALVKATNWRVTCNGEEIAVSSFSMQFDEGDYAWSGSLVIEDYDDYVRVHRDDRIVVYADDEEYVFIVDGKQRSLGELVQFDFSVELISPTASLDAPRSLPITNTWDTPVMASVASGEHISQPIVWEAVDWLIPAFRLGVENVSAIGIVSMIAASVKAVIETSREGDLYVRPMYYRTTEFFYEDAAPDYVVDDATDVFTVRESYSTDKLANLIRIRDVEVSYADSLEWIPDEGSATEGELRAFPSPYRSFDNAPVSTTSEAPTVTLVPIEEVEYEIEEPELVEILDGKGNTRYPIHEVVSVVWESAPLPNVIFEPGAKGVQVTGSAFLYGLMRIIYRTRYHSYRVSGTIDRAAQFLMSDTSGA